MLQEFKLLEERDPRLMQRVTQVVGHLLRYQFLHVEDRGGPSLMLTLQHALTERLIADFFDVAGYRLVVRESEGWAGLLPDPERVSAPRMRIEETLVLLILRRLWEERVQNGDIVGRGAVLLTLNEAYDAYQDVVSRARRPALPIGAFRDQVEGLERRAIVRLGGFDEEAQDIELTIRPIVAIVAGDDFVAHLEQLLQRPDLVDDPEPAEGDPAEEAEA